MRPLLSLFTESSRSFEEQEPGENVVLLLRRHPFVILLPLGLIALAALAPFLVLFIFYTLITTSEFLILLLFLASIYYIVLWLLAFHAITMYTLDTVIVTDRRIIEREQNGFFDRKVSELHHYRVQDISVYTRGIIETFLKFGDVIVQTAASDKEFVFHQMPNPEHIKDTIMKIVSSKHSGVKTHRNVHTEHSRGVHNSR